MAEQGPSAIASQTLMSAPAQAFACEFSEMLAFERYREDRHATFLTLAHALHFFKDAPWHKLA